MSNKSEENRIRILVTSDVHGKIFPKSYGDGSPVDYGFAKVFPIIKELRNENSILIDNGDTLEGSPLQMHHFKEVKNGHSPVTKVMAQMKYDYINLGNHDFDYGQSELLSHIKETGAVLLTANIRGEGFSEKKYVIKEISGKKIALLGVITHFVEKWETEENVRGLEFRDAFDVVKETVEEIKSKDDADYIICIYHGGFERDPETGDKITEDTGENQGYRMLTEIEGIDILITGHQHRTFSGKSGKTAYIQPGYGGSYLSCIDIDIESGEIRADLIPVGKEVDEDLLDLVKEREEECQKWLDLVIGRTNIDLSIGTDSSESDIRLYKPQIATFINQVQMEVCNGDLAAFSVFSDARGFGKEITIRDLVSTYKFSNTLQVKRVTGKILKEYLEKNMEFWTVDDGKIEINPDYLYPIPQFFNYDMVDGIEYTAKISNPPGERIVALTRKGIPVADDMEFDFVLNNFRGSGGGGYTMFSKLPVIRENLTDMVELLLEYIQEKKIIDFEPVDNIKIII